MDAEYRKSVFENENTYIFKRSSVFKDLPVCGFAEFLNSIFLFAGLKERKAVLEKSNTFSYICTYYECRTEVKGAVLSIHTYPGMKLKSFDPAHYSSVKKMTERIQLNTEMIHNGISFAVFAIDEKGFHLNIQDAALKSSGKGTLQFNSRMQVSLFGMNIYMNGLKYRIEYSQNDRTESYVLGRYEKTDPEIKTAGSILSNAVDILIPGNIEGYFRMYFRQAMFGNSKKGNNFEGKSEVRKGRMNIYMSSESEIPRNPFRFLAGKNSEKNAPVFMDGLESAVLKDL